MFRTMLLELFLPFRPFKKTVNIRWTTISTHTRTKQNGMLLLRDKEARQLSTWLNRWLNNAAVTDWTIQQSDHCTKNLKSLENMVCCHPVKLPLQTKERSRYVRLLWKQNLWMATNWKRYLKSEFALFSDVVNLIHISFNFSNVGDIFWGWDPKRPYLSLEKEKKLLNGGAELSRTRLEPKENFFVKIFRKQRWDGGNAEMPMDSNDQYRLCNCSFKVKIIFLIRLKKRNVRAKFWSFSSNLQEVGLRWYVTSIQV